MSNTAAIALTAVLAVPFTQAGLAQVRSGPTVTADDVVARPLRYAGQHIQVRASVEDVYNRSWFSIDDDEEWSTGRDLLVLNPQAVDRAENDSDVTVTGRLVTFADADELRRATEGEFERAPNLAGPDEGRPVLLADSIVTEEGRELVRRPVTVQVPGPANVDVSVDSVKTGDIEDDFDDHLGRMVRTDSEVDKLYSRSIFTIDDDVVVIAPGLEEQVSIDMDVTIVGTVVRFDRRGIEQAARGYRIDLLTDAERELMGRPAIVARSVRTEAGVELMGATTSRR